MYRTTKAFIPYQDGYVAEVPSPVPPDGGNWALTSTNLLQTKTYDWLIWTWTKVPEPVATPEVPETPVSDYFNDAVKSVELLKKVRKSGEGRVQKEMVEVKIDYFKPTGKWYSEASFKIELEREGDSLDCLPVPRAIDDMRAKGHRPNLQDRHDCPFIWVVRVMWRQEVYAQYLWLPRNLKDVTGERTVET